MTMDDLAAHSSSLVEPISSSPLRVFFGITLWKMVGQYVRGNMLLPKCVMIHDDETCHDTCLQNLRSRHHEKKNSQRKEIIQCGVPDKAQ